MLNKYFITTVLITGLLVFVQCNRKVAQPSSKPSVSQKAPAKNSLPASSNKDESFEKFYNRFHVDSIFQLKRVQFPLKGKQVNFKGSQMWDKAKWTMIKAKANEVNPSEFTVKTIKKIDSYFEGIYCKNCGFSFEMEFRLIDGKWYLVYLQENDL